MTTKPAQEKFKCTEPGCTKEYNDKAHLGIHKRSAHGIVGTSHNSIYARKKREAKKAAAAAPPKRKYTKRSTTLATIPQESNGHLAPTHGQAQAPTRRFAAEAALAIAFDRFKELSKNVAFEYDLPPRSFTARLLELLHTETIW